MPEIHHYLIYVLALLGAAVFMVPIFQRLGFGSVLGYLVAGAVLGPSGVGLFDEVEEIREVAEFGVLFLLFIIGIELKPARLWVMRHTVFGLGSAQVMLTGLVLAGFAMMFGLSADTALITGFGLALSSTAFDLQILSERGELGTSSGRAAFSVLLLQDLAVVPLLALVSLLGQETSLVKGVEFAILQALFVIAVVIIAGRFLLTPVLRLVASDRPTEIFTATAVLAVLGTAWLTMQVGLSMALGAFLAGLMLADSDYRHQIIADMQPFRGILLGLFFMAVGMSIDFDLLNDHALTVASLVIGLLLIKTGLLWALCRVMGIDNGSSARVAFLLSQSGEFGFVLFGVAVTTGVMNTELFQLLVLVIGLTMVTTPFMAALGRYVDMRLAGQSREHDVSTTQLDEGKKHVIVAGFGRVGRRVAKILEAGQIPYLALDKNAECVAHGRDQNFSVFYGDASQKDVLQAAGAKDAGVLVVTIDQPGPAEQLVRTMRQNYPRTPIYARGHDREHCERLRKAGATRAISETLEASAELGSASLGAIGVDEKEATRLLEGFRREYYGH